METENLRPPAWSVARRSRLYSYIDTETKNQFTPGCGEHPGVNAQDLTTEGGSWVFNFLEKRIYRKLRGAYKDGRKRAGQIIADGFNPNVQYTTGIAPVGIPQDIWDMCHLKGFEDGVKHQEDLNEVDELLATEAME